MTLRTTKAHAPRQKRLRDFWLLTFGDLLLLLLCFFLSVQAGEHAQPSPSIAANTTPSEQGQPGALLANKSFERSETAPIQGPRMLQTSFFWSESPAALTQEHLWAGLGSLEQVAEFVADKRVLLRLEDCWTEGLSAHTWQESVQRLADMQRQVSDRLLPQRQSEVELQARECATSKDKGIHITVRVYG